MSLTIGDNYIHNADSTSPAIEREHKTLFTACSAISDIDASATILAGVSGKRYRIWGITGGTEDLDGDGGIHLHGVTSDNLIISTGSPVNISLPMPVELADGEGLTLSADGIGNVTIYYTVV
jgi:hypothetical protein